MSKIFVTGHRNPDTDSIVAAMAYAGLRNSLGDRDYEAVRIGSVNDETARMLKRFGFEPPKRVSNLRTQVCDLDYDRPPELNRSVTLDYAWHIMKNSEISAMPILNDDGTLYGMLSAGDIAAYDLQTISNSSVSDLPLFNLISVLEGRLVNEYGNYVNRVSGEVIIALPQAFSSYDAFDKNSIIICGDQPDVIAAALERSVNCLILCQTEISKELVECASPTCIISTPLDARKTARLIYQAVPAERVSVSEGIVSFHVTDFLDDVRETLLKSRYRCYPVLDENEHVVGTLSRYHLLRPGRKQVVLVDHNESSQSVLGLEQVDILEIIDHHRLADIQTALPISVRNEPVGSTNTIITAMYQEHGVVPSKNMAGLMAAAILSDTVMFKSPTCTKRDVAMAQRLARIAGVSLEDLGNDLFSATTADGKSAEELFLSDYKQFHISEQYIGVSQITCADSSRFIERRDEFLEVMARLKKDNGFDLMLLMITDVLKEGTTIIYLGSDETIRLAFSAEPKNNTLFLPGVMSRKKQIIPMLTTLWG